MAVHQTSGPRTYRSVVEGFELAKQFQRSGLTAGEFARQHQITRRNLNYWVGRASILAGAAANAPTSAPPPAPVGFVEVTPPSSLPTLASTTRDAPAIEIRLPKGAVIEVRPGFDAAVLRSVMEVLSC